MQSVLSPIVGRLRDELDQKYLATMPPLLAFVGAMVSAKATSMPMLIGGDILIGITLSTISIVQAIPSEVLPLKSRVLANGTAFLGFNPVRTLRVRVAKIPNPLEPFPVRVGDLKPEPDPSQPFSQPNCETLLNTSWPVQLLTMA